MSGSSAFRVFVLAVIVVSAIGLGIALASSSSKRDIFLGGNGTSGALRSSAPASSATPAVTASSSVVIANPTESATLPVPSPTSAIPIGETSPIIPSSAKATGRAPTVSGPAGETISYGPELAADGFPVTAWCVPGDGTGQSLTLRFSQPLWVFKVGIIPGYDKVDPTTAEDRFYENRRISSVRFSLRGGATVTERPDVNARRMQKFSMTPTLTEFVRIEPLKTTLPTRSDRDYTCISEATVIGITA